MSAASSTNPGFEAVAARIEAAPAPEAAATALPEGEPQQLQANAGDELIKKFLAKAVDPAQVARVIDFVTGAASQALKQPCIAFDPSWESPMWGEAIGACVQRFAPYLLGLTGYPELEMLAWCVVLTGGRIALQWERKKKTEPEVLPPDPRTQPDSSPADGTTTGLAV